jgi:glycogen synthase
MKILHLTNEYPPNVYGGAGVHVEHLTRELAQIADVEVRCFGEQNEEGATGKPSVRGFSSWQEAMASTDPRHKKVLDPLSTDLAMAAMPVDAQIVHCHTWYSMMAGLWAKLLHNIPLVVTTHSLEPLRPWKEEQLGNGYALSSWIERTAILAADAVIAVSHGTRAEVLDCYPVDEEKLTVIYNGVDVDVFRRSDPEPVLRKYKIPTDKPYLLFVGRITRQKGVLHLVHALRHVVPELQVVLCAGAPDTPEIEEEMEGAVRELQAQREGVHWIREMVPVPDLVRFYSGASLFVCPSIYEPFGIINLEAMATGCPVVASRVGGIPEAVADGETGILVPFESRPSPEFAPQDPAGFSRDLADAINRLFGDEALRSRMSEAGRRRVEEKFSWRSIAEETLQFYEKVVAGQKTGERTHA